MKSHLKFFASILLMVLCFTGTCCAQTKIDWKQIKNIPDTLDFKNVLLEHLLFKSAYQPVMESVHQGAIYYDNQLEKLRVYENGQWRDLSVTIASDSIGAPLTILGYLQASDIYASQSAYIGKDVNVKGNINGSGTTRLNSLIVNNTLKIPTVASKTLGVGSIYYDTVNKQLKILNNSNQWEPISIDVDPVLSATSTNPVQNKVIYTKFDNFEASTTEQLQQALLDAYAYANGIATLAYNYTDATATNTKNYADNAANNASNSAYTAAVNYANAQILVIDGRINTLSTNLFASLTQGISQATTTAGIYASSAVSISEGYTQTVASNTIAYTQGLATQTLNTAYAYTDALKNYVDMAIATASRDTLSSATELFVSDVYTGQSSGTIKVLKNHILEEVAVCGLGSAAYTNVASLTPQPTSTPPSNPYEGQMYFDTYYKAMRYWDGTKWRTIQGCALTRVSDANAHYWGSVITMGAGVQRVSIQCGRSLTETDIYFSQAFKSGTIPAIVLGDTAGPFNYYVSSVTNSSFRIERSGYESTTSPSTTIYWIAIGQVDDN